MKQHQAVMPLLIRSALLYPKGQNGHGDEHCYQNKKKYFGWTQTLQNMAPAMSPRASAIS
jgi:hypothetical protein